MCSPAAISPAFCSAQQKRRAQSGHDMLLPPDEQAHPEVVEGGAKGVRSQRIAHTPHRPSLPLRISRSLPLSPTITLSFLQGGRLQLSIVAHVHVPQPLVSFVNVAFISILPLAEVAD